MTNTEIISTPEQDRQFETSFLSRRLKIRRSMLFLYIVIFFLLKFFITQSELIIFIISIGIFLLFAILIVSKANRILTSNVGKYEITFQLIFEVILLVSNITNKFLDALSKFYERFKNLVLVFFFLISYIFLSLNGLNLMDGLIYFHQGNYILAYSHLLTNMIAGSYFLYFYIFVVFVISLQSGGYIWRIWQRYAGYIFLGLLGLVFIMPFIIQSGLKGYFWSYYTSLALMISLLISETFWLIQTTNKRLPENGIIISDYIKNYTLQSLIGTQTTNLQEIVKIYKRWKEHISSYPKYLINKIPYILDTPINHSLEDKLGLREIAEKIFQYITNIELQTNANSVVIGVDGPRGSGKTSIINILKNDHLGYVRDQILTFEFHAWSYSNGNIIDGFLIDFGIFCNKNGILIERDIKLYIDSLERLHKSFGILNLFIGFDKTNSERINSISAAIRKSKKKIVIIIDDVDRISNPDNINDILKLLRSTANFYGVFYILNYSKEEFLCSKNTGLISALKDFEEKFLNWKIEVPSMEIIGLGQDERATLLATLISEELTMRGGYMITAILSGLSNEIDIKTRNLIKITNDTQWSQECRKTIFLEILGDTQSGVLSYFERSINYCIQSLVDPQYNTNLIMGNIPNRDQIINAVRTPRRAKFIINEALRLLSLEDVFIEDYFADIKTYIYRETHNHLVCTPESRINTSLLNIPTPTLFGNRLKEVIYKTNIVLE